MARTLARSLFDIDPSKAPTAEGARRLKQVPPGTPQIVTSVLKRSPTSDGATGAPYPRVERSRRSQFEMENGRPPERRVKIVLPQGHVDRPPRQSPPRRRNKPSRRGLSLVELRKRYIAVCGHFNVRPTTDIMEAFDKQEEAGSALPPTALIIKSQKRVNIEEALSLCEVILQNAHLRHLDLSDCGLRDDHIEKVCNALIFRRNIDRLSLADNPRIGIDGVRFLAVVMQRCMLLTYLNVSGIRFSAKMAAHFGYAVSKSKLRTLIIHRAGLKSGTSLSSIILGCADCQSLSSLSLKSNEIGQPSGVESVGELLDRVTNLACLDMRCNNLTDQSVMLIAPSLVNPSSHLAKLVLYANKITHAGAIALFVSLRQNKRLQYLDLSANDIGTATAMAVFKEMVQVNRSLESIFLWKIGLDDQGVVALSEGLVENTSVKRLELRNNSISAGGLMALCHAVMVNKSIFKIMVEVPEGEDEELSLQLYSKLQRHCALNLQTAHATAIVHSTAAKKLGAPRSPNAYGADELDLGTFEQLTGIGGGDEEEDGEAPNSSGADVALELPTPLPTPPPALDLQGEDGPGAEGATIKIPARPSRPIDPVWAASVAGQPAPTANREHRAPSPTADVGESPAAPRSPAHSLVESEASKSDDDSVSSVVIVAPDALDGLAPSLLSLARCNSLDFESPEPLPTLEAGPAPVAFTAVDAPQLSTPAYTVLAPTPMLAEGPAAVAPVPAAADCVFDVVPASKGVLNDSTNSGDSTEESSTA